MAIGAGFSRESLRSALRRGLLVRPRHGYLAVPGPPEDNDVRTPTIERAETARTTHLASLRTEIVAMRDGALAALDSAALVHRLPRPSAEMPSRVQVTRPGASHDSGSLAVLRGSGVPEHQRTVVDGIPTTDLLRTAVDLARGQRLPAALIPLDAAGRRIVERETGARGNALRHAARSPGLRQHAADELRSALAECFGWPGTVAVRTALECMDPASESPLESRSRGWFLESRLPVLQIGYPIASGDRTYWADFCDPQRRVIGEADGWSKYAADTRARRDAWDAERERQGRLEADGWRFVRWTSSDPRRTVLSRMTRALGLMSPINWWLLTPGSHQLIGDARG